MKVLVALSLPQSMSHCTHTRVCFTCLHLNPASHTHTHTHTHTHMLRQTITHSAWWRTTSWYTFMETAYTHNIARVSMLLSLYTSQNEATCLQSVALNTMLPCPFTCSQFRLQHNALLKWTGQSLNWPIACHLIHTHEDPEVLIKLCTSLLWFFFINSDVSCIYACNAVIKWLFIFV